MAYFDPVYDSLRDDPYTSGMVSSGIYTPPLTASMDPMEPYLSMGPGNPYTDFVVSGRLAQEEDMYGGAVYDEWDPPNNRYGDFLGRAGPGRRGTRAFGEPLDDLPLTEAEALGGMTTAAGMDMLSAGVDPMAYRPGHDPFEIGLGDYFDGIGSRESIEDRPVFRDVDWTSAGAERGPEEEYFEEYVNPFYQDPRRDPPRHPDNSLTSGVRGRNHNEYASIPRAPYIRGHPMGAPAAHSLMGAYAAPGFQRSGTPMPFAAPGAMEYEDELDEEDDWLPAPRARQYRDIMPRPH